MATLSYPLTVFYDGACNMCAGQIRKFRIKDIHKRLVFVDISRPDFDAKQFGLESALLQRYIYAKDAQGNMVRGVDTFIWMWQACDQTLLARVVNVPIIKQVGRLIYRFFSRFRYRLFGKTKQVCDFHCAKEI